MAQINHPGNKLPPDNKDGWDMIHPKNHKDGTSPYRHDHDEKRGIKTTAKEMFAQMMDSIELRERDLKEQEMALKKQRLLLQQEYPRTGKAEDVLYLNVGGTQTIAVLRRTLTYFENSILASRFSGRWDDSLEKTPDGQFFIDHDPQVFLPLVNFLRQNDQKRNNDIIIVPPRPTSEFCSMLDYFGLMPHVYPQEWQTHGGTNRKGIVMTRDCPTTSAGSVTISNSRSCKEFMLLVARDDRTKPHNANSFTVEFEQGSRGLVGWTTRNLEDIAEDDEKSDLEDESEDSEDEDPEDTEDYFYFDLCKAKFTVNAKSRPHHGVPWSQKFPVTIVCTRNEPRNQAAYSYHYSVQVLDDDTGARMIMDTYSSKKTLYPFITFSGTVTISNVVYAF